MAILALLLWYVDFLCLFEGSKGFPSGPEAAERAPKTKNPALHRLPRGMVFGDFCGCRDVETYSFYNTKRALHRLPRGMVFG